MLKWSGSFNAPPTAPLTIFEVVTGRLGLARSFNPQNMRTPNTCWKALGNKELPVIATLPGWKTCRSCLWVLNLMDLSGISWRRGIRTVALWRRGYSNRITLLQRYQLVILIILWEENRRNTPPKKTTWTKRGFLHSRAAHRTWFRSFSRMHMSSRFLEYSMVPEAQIAVGAKKAVPNWWRDRSFFLDRFKDTQNKLQVSTSGGLPQ